MLRHQIARLRLAQMGVRLAHLELVKKLVRNFVRLTPPKPLPDEIFKQNLKS